MRKSSLILLLLICSSLVAGELFRSFLIRDKIQKTDSGKRNAFASTWYSQNIGANVITYQITMKINNPATSTTIQNDTNTPDPIGLSFAINYARSIGMNVTILFSFVSNGANYQGLIGRNYTNSLWISFFQNLNTTFMYWTPFISNATQFIIMNEWTFSESRDSQWRSQISTIRSNFSGQIGVVRSFNAPTNLAWEDAIDFVMIPMVFELTLEPNVDLSKREFRDQFIPTLRALERLSFQSSKPYYLEIAWLSDSNNTWSNPYEDYSGTYDEQIQFKAFHWTMELVRELSPSWFAGLLIIQFDMYPGACFSKWDIQLQLSESVTKTYLPILSLPVARNTVSSFPTCALKDIPNASVSTYYIFNSTLRTLWGTSPPSGWLTTSDGYAGTNAIMTSIAGGYQTFELNAQDWSFLNTHTHLEFYFRVNDTNFILENLAVYFAGQAPSVTRSPTLDQCGLTSVATGNSSWYHVLAPLTIFGIGAPQYTNLIDSLVFENTDSITRTFLFSQIRFIGSNKNVTTCSPITNTLVGFSAIQNDSCAESYFGCESCVSNSSCGWCHGVGCLTGGMDGPLNSAAICASWSKNTCPMSFPFSCSSFSSCSMCVADYRCGWCSSTNSCVSGDSQGPFVNNCPSFSFGSCGVVCSAAIHDPMKNVAWNTKYWRAIDNLDYDGVDLFTNTYGRKNAFATNEGTRITVSNYLADGVATSGRIWGHEGGFSYGRFSIKVKPFSKVQNTRTEFELRATDGSKITAFAWDGSQSGLIQMSTTGLTSQSLSPGFNMSVDMFEYSILYYPTFISFIANGTVLRNFSTQSTSRVFPSLGIFLTAAWAGGSPNSEGIYAESWFSDFKFCPQDCSDADCAPPSVPTPNPTPQPSPTTISVTTTSSPSASSPFQALNSSSSSSNVGVIVAVVVVLLIIFIIVGILIAIFIIRRRRSQLAREHQNQTNTMTTTNANTEAQTVNQVELTTSASSSTQSTQKTSKPTNDIASRISAGLAGTSKNYIVPYSELKFEKMLGAGAFGEVWMADYRDAKVAVKKMKATNVEFNEKMVEDFVNEAQIMLKIKQHPNVLSMMALCLDPLCIVMEFAANGSLDVYLKKHFNIDYSTKLKWAREIAAGMKHLHAEGLIHKDLAARNVLLTSDICKVADFGLARITDAGQDHTTASNVGAVKWMAPESLRDSKYSQKSDVYSYGVTLVEIITQTWPFPEYTSVQYMTRASELKIVETLPKTVDPLLKELISETQERNPSDRPDFATIISRLAVLTAAERQRKGENGEHNNDATQQVEYNNLNTKQTTSSSNSNEYVNSPEVNSEYILPAKQQD